MSIVRKQFHVEVKTIDEQAHTVTALVSNAGLDRDGERILPSAFARDLDMFRRNAVHLWGHNASELRNVLGRAVDVQVTGDGLLVTFAYAVEANPEAAIAFGLVKSGALSAYSVGFIPVEYVVPSETVMPEYRDACRVYTRVKLVEISLVAIPSNPEALVVGRQLEAEGLERSQPMNSHIQDAAVRLHAAAANLEAGPDAEGIEAIASICASVAADLLAFAEGAETHELHEVEEPGEVEEQPVPEKRFKDAASLSESNRERLASIYQACKSVMATCEEMASDSQASLEDDDAKAGDGMDSGDGAGGRDDEPTDAEHNAGKSLSLVAWWKSHKQ